MGEVTQLIEQARAGDRGALDRIFALLYPELRQIAHRRLAPHQRSGLLDTTALVNECYVKFVQRDGLRTEDRAHFLAYAATVMRSIIVDTARQSLTDRRGGEAPHVALDSVLVDSLAAPAEEIMDIDRALRELRAIDARLVQVVEMRYFGGMKDGEIAEALGLSTRSVQRAWEKARLLLAHALRG
jgi:RNA polymerase sigma factor (TIGR02999 family)